MKSRNLNFLEPAGPLKACNGTALSLPYVNMGFQVSHPHKPTPESLLVTVFQFLGLLITDGKEKHPI
jgi:hypothetical protein